MLLDRCFVAAVTAVAASLTAADAVHAQVTVGYNTITSVVGAAIVDQTYRQRTTDQYAISGVNVEPIDGGNVFDRTTVWKIYDQSQPWSLDVRDEAGSVDVSKEKTDSQLVQAGRRESVYAVISGPLSGTVQRQTLSPFASVLLPAIIPVTTSVFPEDSSTTQTRQF